MEKFLAVALAGHVPTANIAATTAEIDALPPGAPRAAIAAILTAVGVAAANVDSLSSVIQLERASRADINMADVVRGPALTAALVDVARQADLTDVVRAPALATATANLVRQDPANPVARRGDLANLLTDVDGTRLSKGIGTARGLGIGAIVLALLVGLLLWWKSSSDGGKFETLAAGVTKATAADVDLDTRLQAMVGQVAGHDVILADHEVRIVKVEADLGALNGRVTASEGQVEKLRRGLAANRLVQVKLCMAAGGDKTTCNKNPVFRLALPVAQAKPAGVLRVTGTDITVTR